MPYWSSSHDRENVGLAQDEVLIAVEGNFGAVYGLFAGDNSYRSHLMRLRHSLRTRLRIGIPELTAISTGAVGSR